MVPEVETSGEDRGRSPSGALAPGPGGAEPATDPAPHRQPRPAPGRSPPARESVSFSSRPRSVCTARLLLAGRRGASLPRDPRPDKTRALDCEPPGPAARARAAASVPISSRSTIRWTAAYPSSFGTPVLFQKHPPPRRRGRFCGARQERSLPSGGTLHSVGSRREKIINTR